MMKGIRGNGNNMALFNLYSAVVIGIIFGALSLNTKSVKQIVNVLS